MSYLRHIKMFLPAGHMNKSIRIIWHKYNAYVWLGREFWNLTFTERETISDSEIEEVKMLLKDEEELERSS